MDELAQEKREKLRAAVSRHDFPLWLALRDVLRAYKINPRKGEDRLNQLKDQLRADYPQNA
jgi:hypothetical protein